MNEIISKYSLTYLAVKVKVGFFDDFLLVFGICKSFHTPLAFTLGGKSLHENGYQKVEEYVVAERHQGDEIQRGPRARLLHSIKKDDIPILLCQDLRPHH